MRPPDLSGIQAPVLLIRGRYDRMVPFEVSIAILNHIADSAPRAAQQLRPLAGLRKPAEWPTAEFLAFLREY